MAFGRLTTKWRIFRRNLDFSVKKSIEICEVAACLHNFVIDNDNLNFIRESTDNADFGVEALDDNEGNLGYLPTEDGEVEINPLSQCEDRRKDILVEIIAMDLSRPERNLA